jgi:hypothetical protein
VSTPEDYEDDWDDRESPEECAAAQARAEEPPDWYLEREAEEGMLRHRRDVHGGGICNCPVAEPVYATEAPF